MHRLRTEKKIFSQRHSIIGGVDEAGRGSLAGPVVAACVCCRKKFEINSADSRLKFVNDSKKLTKKLRAQLYEVITAEKGLIIGLGVVGNRFIDRINIGQATKLAMEKAVRNTKIKMDYLLIDGNFKLPRLKVKQEAIVRGDEKIFLIAAASIIAKVKRDQMMQIYHNRDNRFNFDKHKGYGTIEHRKLINIYGPCPLHRRSFAPIKNL